MRTPDGLSEETWVAVPACGACADVVDAGADPPCVWEGAADSVGESDESCLKRLLSLFIVIF